MAFHSSRASRSGSSVKACGKTLVLRRGRAWCPWPGRLPHAALTDESSDVIVAEALANSQRHGLRGANRLAALEAHPASLIRDMRRSGRARNRVAKGGFVWLARRVSGAPPLQESASGRPFSARATSRNSMTSNRRSPCSTFEMNDCGRPSFFASSTWVRLAMRRASARATPRGHPGKLTPCGG